MHIPFSPLRKCCPLQRTAPPKAPCPMLPLMLWPLKVPVALSEPAGAAVSVLQSSWPWHKLQELPAWVTMAPAGALQNPAAPAHGLKQVLISFPQQAPHLCWFWHNPMLHSGYMIEECVLGGTELACSWLPLQWYRWRCGETGVSTSSPGPGDPRNEPEWLCHTSSSCFSHCPS